MNRNDIQNGMPVRSGGGERMGHVTSVDDAGVHIDGGSTAKWSEIIEVRDGEVFVSAHRAELGELAEAAPRP